MCNWHFVNHVDTRPSFYSLWLHNSTIGWCYTEPVLNTDEFAPFLLRVLQKY
jgi:hypothetical protein